MSPMLILPPSNALQPSLFSTSAPSRSDTASTWMGSPTGSAWRSLGVLRNVGCRPLIAPATRLHATSCDGAHDTLFGPLQSPVSLRNSACRIAPLEVHPSDPVQCHLCKSAKNVVFRLSPFLA